MSRVRVTRLKSLLNVVILQCDSVDVDGVVQEREVLMFTPTGPHTKLEDLKIEGDMIEGELNTYLSRPRNTT